MSIDQERLDAFQARMNSWVSSQGLLFQLQHGGTVTGAKSSFMASMVRVVVHLVILALLLLLGFWVYLGQRVGFESFRDGLGEAVARGLHAESVEISGVDRKRGLLVLGRVSIEGGDDSFLEAAELRMVRTRMGLTDGLWGTWVGEDVMMREMQVKVKSGADDEAAAAQAFASLFRELEGFQFDSVTVDEATVFWGYSQMHRGGIRESRMRATREGAGWKVVFTGGQFSQNWLRRLDIQEIVVMVMPDGVRIPEMKLRWDEGTVKCQLAIAGGSRPAVSGSGTMSGVPIQRALKPEFANYVDGRFSGDFEVDGALNSQEGIGLSLNLELAEGDKIELRDKFQLFQAISAVDRFRSYKRVRFTNGRCRIRSGGGQMEVEDIWLMAPDHMRLEGAFVARPPTDEEIQATLNVGGDPTVGGLNLVMEDPAVDDVDEFTLKRAATAAGEDREDEEPARGGLPLKTDPVADLKKAAMAREQRSQQLIGEVRIGLTKDTFSRSPTLEARYPVDADGMRWLTVPMRESIFTVSAKQADQIFEGRREERSGGVTGG